MMKQFLKIMLVLSSVQMVSACVEDSQYYNSSYHSSVSNAAPPSSTGRYTSSRSNSPPVVNTAPPSTTGSYSSSARPGVAPETVSSAPPSTTSSSGGSSRY